jgi:hypothetical protein
MSIFFSISRFVRSYPSPINPFSVKPLDTKQYQDRCLCILSALLDVVYVDICEDTVHCTLLFV